MSNHIKPFIDYEDPKVAWALGLVLGAWITFRQTHDLTSAEVQCCEKTKMLFTALEEYEKAVIKPDE